MATGNPGTDPSVNLNKLPQIDIPTVSPLCAYTKTWIAGDYPELSMLAGRLYDFARSCNADVTQLAGYVETIVGDNHADWVGEAANQFRRTFGGDVTLVSDHAQLVVAVGKVIDKLATTLDSIEASVEERLAPGIESGDFVWMQQGNVGGGPNVTVAWTVQGQELVVLFGSAVEKIQAGRAANAFFRAALDKAIDTRRKATAQLALLSAPLAKSLDMFSSPRGQQVMREDLLRQDQKDDATAAIDKYRKERIAAIDSSGISQDDVKKALANFNTLGGDAQTLVGIAKDLQALKEADAITKVSTGVNTVKSLGSIVNDLVLLLMVE